MLSRGKSIACLLLLLLHLIIAFMWTVSATAITTYNVVNFGAMPDGESNNNVTAEAFLTAWAVACNSTGPTSIYVPPGIYMIGTPIRFNGQSCKSDSITILIHGTLVAPPADLGRSWILFERVNRLSIYGGTIDAQGSWLWACKASKNDSCHSSGSTSSSLEFSHSKNVIVRGLTSLNSQLTHIVIFGCNNFKLHGLKVSAPGNSPNTDGIHISYSSNITVLNSNIGTGDDCISVGPKTDSLWIENIACGPGHGISIGSLGGKIEVGGVKNVTVRTAKFTGTENGVRIKTWAEEGKGLVRDVVFEHITMLNVQNPIVIDQKYCPGHNCPNQSSGIEISDVTYQDIHGTSSREVAVRFDCSDENPCSRIILQDIDLMYGEKMAQSSCSNVDGTASGVVVPSSCLSS
ncbi:polygalacturonase-like [Impatiens glandulifera]|uniref:polygalacturonase-like n=1 Tax=Impatiens glandulifera TaxID=253017 RepID=UPI001FB12326|nr:polygalacturonase-like [Impatiens glandulifera]